jgi:hypothetical protein
MALFGNTLFLLLMKYSSNSYSFFCEVNGFQLPLHSSSQDPASIHYSDLIFPLKGFTTYDGIHPGRQLQAK